jgi:hypothetical protein
MAKSKKSAEFSVDDAAQEVISAFEKFMQTLAAKGGSKVSASDEDDDAEEVEDDEEEELEAPDRETVESLGIKDLRELAEQYGIEEKKKADILTAFEDLYDEEDDEEDEDDEDDDEEGEEEYDRDELADLSLADLRKIAKEEGHKPSEYKGMDQDAIIDLIMGEEDEDEDEEEDEDEDDEAEELDEDDLKNMSHKELTSLAKELGVKVPAALKKDTKPNHKKLVALIMSDAEDDE